MTLLLHHEFSPVFSDQRQEIDRILGTNGEVFREISSRKTLRFLYSGKPYFLKIHRGVGWREIFKNLLQLRLPIISAHTEWKALHKLGSLGIDTLTPVGFGSYGWNPARKQSFLITRELGESVTLQDMFSQKLTPQYPPRVKRNLIRKVAEITRIMHKNGVNHRDYYLCHLRVLVSDLYSKTIENPRVFVLDLHRAQLRARTPVRWIIKDLGALLFSCGETGITQRDVFRFLRKYCNKNLRDILLQEKRFWEAVMAKTSKIKTHHQRISTRQETSIPKWIPNKAKYLRKPT